MGETKGNTAFCFLEAVNLAYDDLGESLMMIFRRRKHWCIPFFQLWHHIRSWGQLVRAKMLSTCSIFFQFVSSLQSLTICSLLENLSSSTREQHENHFLDLPLPKRIKEELVQLLRLQISATLKNYWTTSLHHLLLSQQLQFAKKLYYEYYLQLKLFVQIHYA